MLGPFLTLFYICAQLWTGSPSYGAGPATATIDWKPLFATCDDNWDKYETDLNHLRSTLQRQFDAMPKEDFLKRYMNDDLTIRFVRIHWPSMFTKKDSGWSLYRGCAERNANVRKLLSSPGTSREQRKVKIDELEGCIRGMFAPRGPTPQPFARLLACYRKNNK